MTATTDKSEPVGQGRGEDMQTRLGRLLDEVEAMLPDSRTPRRSRPKRSRARPSPGIRSAVCCPIRSFWRLCRS